MLDELRITEARAPRKTIWRDPIEDHIGKTLDAVMARVIADIGPEGFRRSNYWRLVDLVEDCDFMMVQQPEDYADDLVSAFLDANITNHHFPEWLLPWMFDIAEREDLRAAGDPLPGAGPFTLYRAVAGKMSARRVRGLSWSETCDYPMCFEEQAQHLGLHDPAIYKVTVDASDVLTYIKRAGNLDLPEFIVKLPPHAKPVRC